MTKYIYHSEKTRTTCYECSKNDGKVFYDIKDVPKVPVHPNCKCWVETVEESNNGDKCDCKDRMDVIVDNTNNVIWNAKNLLESIDKKSYDAEIDFKTIAKLLEQAYLKKDIIQKEVGFHNKGCINNADNLYKEITQNIINAELLNKKQEELSNELYELRRNLASFEKEAKDNLVDIEITKEHNYDFMYHTKSECKLNEQLKPLNNKTKELCEKINDFSIKYNKIKTKLNDVKNAVSALNQCLEMIYRRKKTPCACSEIIRGVNQAGVNEIGKAIGPNYNKATFETAKIFSGKDTASMLDLAHGANMNDRNYIKDVYHLKNWDDPAVATDKEYLKDKVSTQFKDYNFDINQIKGYFFKNNSEAVKSLIQNADFRKIIKNHKEDILKEKDFTAGFPKYDIGVFYGNNWRNAVGKIDFKHPWRDKQGNLHIKMYDTYDFNKNEGNLFVRAGAQQMEAGNLKPFFTIHDIIIPSNELDKIFGWVNI